MKSFLSGLLDALTGADGSFSSGDQYDEDDARAKLAELSTLNAALQALLLANPQAAPADWHLEQAADWHKKGAANFADDKFTAAYRQAHRGLFHARLAIEVVAESKYEMARLAHLVNEAVGDADAIDDMPRAEDSDGPDYCDASDDNMKAGFVAVRKLSLLVARARALHTAVVAPAHASFTTGSLLADSATEYLQAAQGAKRWDDVPYLAHAGMFFARQSIEVMTRFMAEHGLEISFDSPDWDDEEDHDNKGSNEMHEAALALADTRSVIGRLARAGFGDGQLPIVSAHFLQRALSRWDEAKEQYLQTVREECAEGEFFGTFDDERWAGTASRAFAAYYSGKLAWESQVVYLDECAHLKEGGDSTCLDDLDDADPDYTDITFEMSESNGRAAVRRLVLKAAKLQALLDVHCAGFTAGRSHVEAALESAKKALGRSDWDDTETVADKGVELLDDAVEAVNTFIEATASLKD